MQLDWRLWVWWMIVAAAGSAALPATLWLYDVVYHAMRGASSYGSDLFPSYPLLLCACGSAVGLGQWVVLRRRLQAQARGWHGALWVVGGAISGLAPLNFLSDTLDLGSLLLTLSVVAGVLATVAGVVEGIALTGDVWWAGLWIAIRGMAGAVGWPLGAYLGSQLIGWTNGANGGYIGSGTLGGLAIAWLARTRSR